MKDIIHNSYYTKLASVPSTSSIPGASISGVAGAPPVSRSGYSPSLGKRILEMPGLPKTPVDPYASASKKLQEIAAKGLKAYNAFDRKITRPSMVNVGFKF